MREAVGDEDEARDGAVSIVVRKREDREKEIRRVRERAMERGKEEWRKRD